MMTAASELNRPRRRVYRDVTVDQDDQGWGIHLDGRPLRTPAGKLLALPSRVLAASIATEWAAQGEQIQPHTMPMTSLACTAVDLVGPQREEIVGELAGYGATELLCYRAVTPPELASRQQSAWQPLLDWAALAYDAPLRTTTAMQPVEQPPEALRALRGAVDALDTLRLTALSAAIRAAGSLIIGLALVSGRIDAETAFDLAELDETFNIDRWGEDPEARRRRTGVKQDLCTARRFLDLLDAG